MFTVKEGFVDGITCPSGFTLDCSGDHEIVGSLCLKKCNAINPTYTTGTSDKNYCKFLKPDKKYGTMLRNKPKDGYIKAMNGCKPSNPLVTYDASENVYTGPSMSYEFHAVTASNNSRDSVTQKCVGGNYNEHNGRFRIKDGMSPGNPGNNATCYYCYGMPRPLVKPLRSDFSRCIYTSVTQDTRP